MAVGSPPGVSIPARRRPGPEADEPDHVALQKFERASRKDDLIPLDRLEPVDRDARRLARIHLLDFKRENLAPVGAGLLHGLLQVLEEPVDDPGSGRVVGCGDLEPHPLDLAVGGVPLQEHGQPDPVGFQQPQAVLQAADRAVLADVDLLVEGRDGLGRVMAARDQQLGEVDPLVVVVLEEAVRAEDLHPAVQQAIDGPLEIGPDPVGEPPLGQ
jgi:hypothetical protein